MVIWKARLQDSIPRLKLDFISIICGVLLQLDTGEKSVLFSGFRLIGHTTHISEVDQFLIAPQQSTAQ